MTELDLDTRLVAAARTGERAAFEELVTRHARVAGRLAARVVRNREDAEDVVQEAFVKAFTHLSAFRADAPFRVWLLRIVLSVAHDHLRRRARQTPHRDPSPVEGVALDLASRDRPEHGDRVERLRAAIDELPVKQRAALLLKVYEGLSHRDVARVIGSTAGATRVYLALARQSLRRRFARWFTDDDGAAGSPRDRRSP